MGGVVCGYDIYGPVLRSLNQGIAVGRRADRGIHLESSLLTQVGVAHRKVVWTRFARYTYTAALGIAYERNALLGRYVAYVITASGLLGQPYVAFDLPPFALR